MSDWFDGKVALVTGGSKGIGKATARALAGEGCSVAICARSADELRNAAREIEDATGRPVLAVPTDMGQPEQVQRFVDDAAKHFGHIDILVNNAGAAQSGSPLDLPDEAFTEAINVKLLGYLRAARAVVPHMRAAGGGRIISIAGGAAFSPGNAMAAAGIVNAGVNNFMKSLADTVAGDGILVTTINPGLIMTDRLRYLRRAAAERLGVDEEEAGRTMATNVPVGFVPGPEAIADVVVFLASQRASYITGTSIVVDGGSNRYAF